MATARTYNDRCGVARALDLIGDRWAMLVVRELLLGPKRFTDLRAGLPHVGPDMLAQRLRELEGGGIVTRRTLAPPAGSRVYELTERGQGLEPVVLALGRWGSAAPLPEGDAAFGADSLVIALKTLFEPGAAGGGDRPPMRCELRLGQQLFRLEVARGELTVTRGAADDPDAVIESDPSTLAAVLWHGRALDEAERSGAVRIGGSRRAARRFLRLFPLAAGSAA